MVTDSNQFKKNSTSTYAKNDLLSEPQSDSLSQKSPEILMIEGIFNIKHLSYVDIVNLEHVKKIINKWSLLSELSQKY